jgi:hypothetical protein
MSTRTPVAPARQNLPDQLRGIIADRGLTPYAVGKLARVDPGIVARFLDGRRDLRLATAGRIAAALGLRLVELARPARGRAPRAAAASPDAGAREE